MNDWYDAITDGVIPPSSSTPSSSRLELISVAAGTGRRPRFFKRNTYGKSILRTEMVLGADGMDVSGRSHVAVFGPGGGSYAVEALVRLAWAS